MAGVKLQAVDISVTVLTSLFQVRGKLRIAGILQTFLNDETKSTISVYDAEVTTFDGNTPALSMQQPEMVVFKAAAQIILFDQAPAQGMISLLPRTESAVAYTDKFAVQGKFYMGTESRIADFVGASAGMFLVAGEVKLYPLTPVYGGIMGEGPLALIHKSAFRTIHKAG